LPTQELSGAGDVRASDPGVILRKRLEHDGAGGTGQLTDFLGELQNGNFFGIAQIDRFMEVREQQADDPFHKIRNVAKGSGLGAVAINRDRLIAQSLTHEVGQGPTVVEPHPLAVSVEDADDMGVEIVNAVVGHRHGFGKTFGFVIHSPHADRIDIPPVGFLLRMFERIAVHLAGASQQIAGVVGLGNP
jgi:hypothetical protein